MAESDFTDLVLEALDPALRAARLCLLDQHRLLAEGPLHTHPDVPRDDPEIVADEILFALDHLRDALQRYRRLTRVR